MSDKNWSDLRIFLQIIRKTTDEIWKVWRWFGVGLLGFIAYERTEDISTAVFGIMMSFFGVAALFSWLFEGNILGITEKGRNSGLPVQLTIFTSFLLISVYFAVWVWASTTLIALPVFDI